MKRRGFLGKVAGGAVAGVTTGMVSAQAQTAESSSLVKTPAVIMAPRADGVEVVWAVSKLARGHVEWKGEDGSSGTAGADRFGFVPQGDEILRVRVTGLKPGGRYSLRAVTESTEGKDRVEGPWKKFRTLDPSAGSTSFVIWNDTHQNEETLKRLHASTPPGDFLLWNGDTCNDWHQEDWLVPTLLHPAGQDVSADRPLLLVWGNHDVRGKWAFKVPEMVATPDGRPFYAFRSGPLAVLCLHTGEDKPDNHPSFGGRVAFEALRREQAEWIRQVTAQPDFRDAPYRVVFCHIPLRWTEEVGDAGYEKGGYDAFSRSSREAWHDVLVAWRAQVIISGHTHSPAWIEATAQFPYAQLVGGGPQPDRATWIEGKADANALSLVMKDLAGKVVREVLLKPVG
jgi:predicted phosphodiesterase